jgi:hypothetical protein
MTNITNVTSSEQIKERYYHVKPNSMSFYYTVYCSTALIRILNYSHKLLLTVSIAKNLKTLRIDFCYNQLSSFNAHASYVLLLIARTTTDGSTNHKTKVS